MEAYVKWANRVRFEYCDLTVPVVEGLPEAEQDQTPNYKFYFNNEARMLANSDIPKRSLAIAKEVGVFVYCARSPVADEDAKLAVLTTNLPVAWNSSVFLRVDETRVDVIKALITGPEGTPCVLRIFHRVALLTCILSSSSDTITAGSFIRACGNGAKFILTVLQLLVRCFPWPELQPVATQRQIHDGMCYTSPRDMT